MYGMTTSTGIKLKHSDGITTSTGIKLKQSVRHDYKHGNQT